MCRRTIEVVPVLVSEHDSERSRGRHIEVREGTTHVTPSDIAGRFVAVISAIHACALWLGYIA